MTTSALGTLDTELETEDTPVELPESAAASRRASVTPLLLEVGCEEIPARFLRDAEKALGERVLAALQAARLLPEAKPSGKPPVQTYSTPRRLTVQAARLRAQQPDKVEEILGPPVKVAVDAAGKYTRAAESFALKNSARLEDLARTTTPKGEYLSLQKTTAGRPTREILAEILPPAILGISFPKSMYWTSKSDPRFVRPIRWVLAILGNGKLAETIDFELLGVKSGNFTFGHRALGPKALSVTGFKNYTNKLEQAHVEIDYTKRCDRIVKEAQAALGDTQGRIVQDEWLVDWIANATEWPRPVLGSFEARFLHLPREILITVMRDHQRYFAVEEVVPGDAQPEGRGKLLPHFVAVLNMDSDEKGLIRRGHQRVLTARFRDAEFFWAADQRTPLRDRVPLLDKVTYQVELGSYGDKVQRISKIAEYICVTLEEKAVGQGNPADPAPADKSAEGLRQQVRRAVELCKCDLTAQMVQEFTELQGIVGGLYAQEQGEPAAVATAIYDHYLPLGAEGGSPRNLVGAVVSLADKFDSVVAGFAVGNEPTGSSDPFALRRQGNGIIKVLLELSLPIDLREIVKKSLDALEDQWQKSSEQSGAMAGTETPIPNPEAKAPRAGKPGRRPREVAYARVVEFLAERLRYYLESVRKFRYDTVRAVVAAGADQPADAQARAEAMEALRGGEDFEPLSAAAKRIRNILAKSASMADWQPGEIDAALLGAPEEMELSDAYRKVAAGAQVLGRAHDYRGALELISTLRPAVDRFFDQVLVMAEDRALRQNRLRLLKKLDELFSEIAHFAEIEGQ